MRYNIELQDIREYQSGPFHELEYLEKRTEKVFFISSLFKFFVNRDHQSDVWFPLYGLAGHDRSEWRVTFEFPLITPGLKPGSILRMYDLKKQVRMANLNHEAAILRCIHINER